MTPLGHFSKKTSIFGETVTPKWVDELDGANKNMASSGLPDTMENCNKNPDQIGFLKTIETMNLCLAHRALASAPFEIF